MNGVGDVLDFRFITNFSCGVKLTKGFPVGSIGTLALRFIETSTLLV